MGRWTRNKGSKRLRYREPDGQFARPVIPTQDCPKCGGLMVKQGGDAPTTGGFIDPAEFNRFRCYTCEPLEKP